ncbi:hypothetical protein CAEBREN_24057 [Caenorhabditis brenneri]|uniref:RRM domain-containing protein n=1 Tax=Caenorhabditis brenneri TaxID=135651 RepID=G0MZH4_CAEBE|nr:hypothetical protein CAEBREN_24057 [Caenorhabditis brenneri]
MNPITNIKNQNRMNERELSLGYAGDLKKSWHQTYKDSAWIYIGGLSYALSEGDVIAVFSQYGEVMNVNLIRDKDTGKSKGFAFLCYKDQRSTVLAVDNFNGITLHKRMIRVDHVEKYKVPNYKEDADEETRRLWEEGCAPKAIMREAEPMEVQEKRIKKAKELLLDVGDIDEELLKKIKMDKKKAKKEKKQEKKRAKKLKKLEKKAARDPDGDWKNKAKLIDKVVAEDDLYGENKHFDFGKKKEVEEVKHNPRPDFEKADWRDIEIWKVIREREKAEKAAKGESTEAWGPEEHYVSKRYQGR